MSPQAAYWRFVLVLVLVTAFGVVPLSWWIDDLGLPRLTRAVLTGLAAGIVFGAMDLVWRRCSPGTQPRLIRDRNRKGGEAP